MRLTAQAIQLVSEAMTVASPLIHPFTHQPAGLTKHRQKDSGRALRTLFRSRRRFI